LPDPEVEADKVERLVLCGGKVYYDLLEKREADGIADTAVVRIEQLYPFPEQRLLEIMKPFRNLKTVVWCQEEPQNQGAWYCSQHHMRHVVHQLNPVLYLEYAGRDSAAAPAVGSMALHVEQQQKLIQDAFGIR